MVWVPTVCAECKAVVSPVDYVEYTVVKLGVKTTAYFDDLPCMMD